MSANSSINIVEWNANGVRNKVHELQEFIDRYNIDVLLLCETKLCHTVKFELCGYITYRADNRNRAGGVAICVKQTISHEMVPSTATDHIENISIKLRLNSGDIVVTSAYSPRYVPCYMADIRKLTSRRCEYLIFGDLNARHPFWGCAGTNRAGKGLYKLQQRHGFIMWSPVENTFIGGRGNPSIIDVVITNSIKITERPVVLNELPSDHCPVLLVLKTTPERRCPKLVPNYHRANWQVYQEFIEGRMDSVTINMNTPADIDGCVEQFTRVISDADEQAVPRTVHTPHGLELSDEILHLIRRRNALKRRWSRSRLPNIRTEIGELNAIIKCEISKLKNENWQNAMASFRTGDRRFWKAAKRARASHARLSHKLVNQNGVAAYSEADRCEMLADAFAKSHVLTANYHHPIETDVEATVRRICVAETPDDNNEMLTNHDEMIRLLRGMKNMKAPGNDGIFNILLKRLPDVAIIRMCDIFNACFRCGYFPDQWKIAKIVPIPKPGQNHDAPGNYRPISLLNTMSKLFERIIQERMLRHIDENDLLLPEQFGFRRQHSTTHQLLRVIKHIRVNAAKRRKSTGMVLLDVEKAFDSVWHNGLIYKLQQMQFPMTLTKLLMSYLSNRKFGVSVGDAVSALRNVPAGVPQGSVLGPLLYGLYMSDITCPEFCELALYADDTALYSTARFAGTAITKLTAGLHCLLQYFQKWKIKINCAKTQAIYFAYRRGGTQIQPSTKVRADGCDIEWADEVKYLGLTIDRRLTFAGNTTRALERAMRAYHALYPLIRRGSWLSVDNKNVIYKGVLMPIVLYASPVWKDMARTHYGRLQRFQNGILRTIYGLGRNYPTIRLHAESDYMPIRDRVAQYAMTLGEKCGISDYELIRRLVD